MIVDIDRMRKRNERRLEEAKRLEFESLANSAVESKKHRSSPTDAGRTRLIKSAWAFLAVVLSLLLIVLGSVWFTLRSHSNTGAEVVKSDLPPTQASSHLTEQPPNASKRARSLQSRSSGLRSDASELANSNATSASRKKQRHVFSSRRAFSQKELNEMPPDVRAEALGRKGKP